MIAVGLLQLFTCLLYHMNKLQPQTKLEIDKA